MLGLDGVDTPKIVMTTGAPVVLKNSKVRSYFSVKKRYIGKNKVAFDKVMTQIFDPKNCGKYLENKICIYYDRQ